MYKNLCDWHLKFPFFSWNKILINVWYLWYGTSQVPKGVLGPCCSICINILLNFTLHTYFYSLSFCLNWRASLACSDIFRVIVPKQQDHKYCSFTSLRKLILHLSFWEQTFTVTIQNAFLIFCHLSAQPSLGPAC